MKRTLKMILAAAATTAAAEALKTEYYQGQNV